MRLGLGPVFNFEWLTTSRRWQVYAGRSLFVVTLFVALAVVWGVEVAGRRFASFRDLARVGRAFYDATVGTQLVLILAAAPAATAGAICQDKARGTLAHVLVTDLSDVEIVLGKLAARLVPVLGFVGCVLPLMALGTLLGGVDPEALAGAFLVTLGLAVLGATLALTLSVWASKTHEVLLATYMIWAVWLLARPVRDEVFGLKGVAGWIDSIDPFWLTFAPSAGLGLVSLAEQVRFFGGCLLVSAALAALATARTRAVAVRQADRRRRPPGRLQAPSRASGRIGWWPGPTLDPNPVLWREWHRNRPSRWGFALGILYALLATAFTLLVIVEARVWGSRGELAPWVNGIQAGAGLLLAAVVAATSLSEERARGSLDVLMATPLTTPAIVRGKWLGAFRGVPALAILPGLLSFALVYGVPGRWQAPFVVVGLILAYGAALASLGLALATWIPRPGRVVTLTVAAHVFITVGWFFLMHTAVRGELSRHLGEASPFFGVGMVTALTVGPPGRDPAWNGCVTWAVVWIAFYALSAIALFLATLASFDRRLGRIPDRPDRRHSKARLGREFLMTRP